MSRIGTYEGNCEQKANWQDELKASHAAKKIIEWDFKDRDSLQSFWFSDIHWGHHACDKDLVKRNIDMVAKKQIPCADLGDLIENATRDSVGAGVYEQDMIADGQMEEAIALYEPIKHLLKVMQAGNHELRSFNGVGINPTRWITKMLGVPYGGVGVMHKIKVGSQTYTGYSVHGGSCATTVAGKLNALLKLGQIVEADFYIQGHTHDTIYQSKEIFRLDPRNGSLVKRRQHFINNGAYLNYWNTYGQVKAYAPGSKGSAMLTFSGKEKQIEVSFV
jgi:predicted phosphodiesterase